jgi:hypothetical protein
VRGAASGPARAALNGYVGRSAAISTRQGRATLALLIVGMLAQSDLRRYPCRPDMHQGHSSVRAANPLQQLGATFVDETGAEGCSAQAKATREQ